MEEIESIRSFNIKTTYADQQTNFNPELKLVEVSHPPAQTLKKGGVLIRTQHSYLLQAESQAFC